MNETLEWLIASFSLLLVLEGIMPFASPATWKNAMTKMLLTDDKSLRLTGLLLMLTGSLTLWYIHN